MNCTTQLVLYSSLYYGPVIDALHLVIDEYDNLELTAPFLIHEFKEIMFSMHCDECLGLDGFSPEFY
jgi:hypothetical protein